MYIQNINANSTCLKAPLKQKVINGLQVWCGLMVIGCHGNIHAQSSLLAQSCSVDLCLGYRIK